MIKHIKNLVIFLTVILAGCARFQGNQTPTHEAPSNTIGEFTTVTYLIRGNVESKDERLLKEIMYSYGIKLEWGQIREDGTPHLDIDFSFRRNGAAVVPAIITGATFYFVPSWQTQYYTLTTHLKNTEIDYSFRAKDHTVLVQWLPMIIAFPFADPFTAESKLVEKVYTDLAFNISEQLKNNK
ncbi:hypothetical protein [Vibrio sp. 1CM23M]|uniref:hypothetical protein n=1 Tax=Vibrio sp. 1CM23M TaxID=2929164 RepID=UPI0020BFFCF6|nr:hypothetical protein [Vibrio sp. 1CM23M]MCK8072219.1 hypothetical protein [Vibrio sp. 1CM23M]